MKKPLQKIIGLLIFLILLSSILYYDAVSVAPTRFTVRYETIRSDSIPRQLDDVSILFISDIYYNQHMDEQRFQKVVDLINKASPDVVIFLGDLLASGSSSYNDETSQTLIRQLSEINAPLGKFAVLGDTDLESFSSKEVATSILQNSGFEIITNQVVYLRNQGSESIALVGLDSIVLGEPTIQDTFSNVAPGTFSLVVTHAPDIITELPPSRAHLQVSGHSLGGQIFFPILGGLIRLPGAELYYRGTHNVNGIRLDITNGIGTMDKDVRFLTNAELLMYTLKSTAKPSATLDTIPTVTDSPEETTPTPETDESLDG